MLPPPFFQSAGGKCLTTVRTRIIEPRSMIGRHSRLFTYQGPALFRFCFKLRLSVFAPLSKRGNFERLSARFHFFEFLRYIAPYSSLYPCLYFPTPPHRSLARIMCDEPAFHRLSQGVRDNQITGASHRYRIVSSSSGEGGGRDTPSTAIGDAILRIKDLSRLWGLLEVQLNSITRRHTLDLGLFRTWKNRAGFGSVGVYSSVGSVCLDGVVVWIGRCGAMWCGMQFI